MIVVFNGLRLLQFGTPAKAAARKSGKIAAVMRRWISTLLAALMLANLAAWPSAVLAEVLEHGHEVAQLEVQIPPIEPSSTHCQHGCAGHYGQHFQWQVAAFPFEPRVAISAVVVATPETFPPQHIPVLPFRPPLSAPILS